MSKIGPLWRDAQQRLQQAGLDPAPHEGRVLVAHAMGMDAHDIILHDNEIIPYEKKDIVEHMLGRRLAGEPLAYITGRAPFWHHDWRVGPGVLIPRPDSETLVRAALAEIETLSASHSVASAVRFAEIGVGSGALTGSLLHEAPTVTAVATDISPLALEFAATNLREIGVLERCKLVETDLLDGVDGPFDLIVSNPPYIGEAEWAALEPGVRDFEPRLALVAGADGLDIYRRLIGEAAAKLRPGGALCLEIGWQQGQAVNALLRGDMTGRWENIQILQDLAQRDRVVMARRPS